MNPKNIENIVISQIRILNPRTRDNAKFQSIVASIKAIGLKRPVTLARREPDGDGTCFDLVCGQGRMEAMLALGQTTIPAIVIDAPRQEQLLMSLAENIARRPPSNRALLRELRILRERNYGADEIAAKLGLDRSYIHGLLHLLQVGEEALISAVDSGRLPISIAMEIASGNDNELQLALSEAYDKGDLRGKKLISAKRIIARRIKQQKKQGKVVQAQRKMTGDALVREYHQHLRQQQALVKKANVTKERLLLLTSAMRRLFSDEHFLTLLRAEGLHDIPEQLAVQLN